MTKHHGILIGMLVALLAPSAALAEKAPDALPGYLAELRKAPDDVALREKILRHVKGMRRKPKAPPELDGIVGKATLMMKTAKSPRDLAAAADAYREALVLAPWVADHYFNLGTIQEKAEKYVDAVASFQLYLLAAPDAKDGTAIREKIGGLRLLAEKQGKTTDAIAKDDARNRGER